VNNKGQATASHLETEREALLLEAARIITGDRNTSYDEPFVNFQIIARLWSEYLGANISVHDVAVLNILQKVSRIMASPDKRDHWVDIAGYAACGYEALSIAESITPLW
jgi:hypothetical protein